MRLIPFIVAGALAAPILRPTAAPVAIQKRQIDIKTLSSFTISGAEHESFISAVKEANGGVLGVANGGAPTPSTTADPSRKTDEAGEVGGETEKKEGEEPSETKKEEETKTEENKPEETKKEEKENKDENKEENKAKDNTGVRSTEQDLVVLNFANTLEKLETQFYEEGLKTFSLEDMVHAGLSEHQAHIIIETLKTQAKDEATHSTVLESVIKALGGDVVDKCSFDFSSVLTNPATFLVTARVLELVGVSAYSGGAQLVQNPSILTAAASILSIEARHSTVANLFVGGNAIPQAFDIPLTPNAVLALAGGFLKGCTPEDLGLTSNQPLSVVAQETGTGLIKIGSQLAFQSPALDRETDADNTFCQMLVGGASEALVFPIADCKVPEGINGPVMIFITSDDTPLVGDAATQDQTTTIAGPAAIFVDSNEQKFESIFAIQGVGLGTLANLDAGKLNIEKGGKKHDVVKDSHEYRKENYHKGMSYYNEKRGYSSGPARILGWN